jgi:acyl-coenzyme A thioesterase PaaI-like protein
MITITMDTDATTTERVGPGVLHRDCFACGGFNAHGLKLHFEVDADGVAAAVWQPSGDFLSYADRVHGGIIATLLDSSMVHALFAQGVAGVTAELTIRYLQGVNIDDPIHVSGWMESTRLGIYLCRAEVRQAGSPVVRASAKFVAMPDPPRHSPHE